MGASLNEIKTRIASTKKTSQITRAMQMVSASKLTKSEASSQKFQVYATKVREIVKRYDIRCIHMVISSSVAFTFFLGAGFSSQHDPDIIVYHYDNGKYIWGIDMKRNGSDAVIIP